MNQVHAYFDIKISKNKLFAEILCTDLYESSDINLDKKSILNFLEIHKVIYGIDIKIIESILSGLSSENFPVIIAKGMPSINGKDGSIEYVPNYCTEIVKEVGWNFRDVMRIPSVNKGDKLATISLPTKGTNGMNVLGTVIQARPGKPNPTKAGKNIAFNEEDLTFYATCDGQVSITERLIQVHSLYEVNENLSMKTGNLDFIGSIIIRGNVPTGYTVKAEGDIKIFGIVEAATVTAGGSIYISEGLAGLQKGTIQAKENVHIGYINQGIVHAGDSIFVENSIIHSECTAKNKLHCQHGFIIGGSLSVGKSIEAKDIGNRLSTETIINLGLDKTIDAQQTKLERKRKELEETLAKLAVIGEKLKSQSNKADSKIQLTLLRQRNSKKKVTEQINLINDQLFKMDAYLGKEDEAELIVKNIVYSNVIIAFGKYKRKINSNRKSVLMKLEKHKVTIHSLE